MFDKGQGYVLAYRADSTVMVHGTLPKLEGTITNGKDSNGVLIASAVIAAAQQASKVRPRPICIHVLDRMSPTEVVFARKFAPWNVVISIGVYVDDLDADMNALLMRLGSIGAGVLALMALLSWLISSDILGALRRLQSRMHDIANGALDAKVEETDRGDEIGRMAETLEMLRQTSLTARSLEAEQTKMKSLSEAEKRDALIALANRFDASVGQLVGLMASGSRPSSKPPRNP